MENRWKNLVLCLSCLFRDQNDVVTGHCLDIGELEGARSGKKRAGRDSLRDQQAPQEASNKLVSVH